MQVRRPPSRPRAAVFLLPIAVSTPKRGGDAETNSGRICRGRRPIDRALIKPFNRVDGEALRGKIRGWYSASEARAKVGACVLGRRTLEA